MKKLMIIFLLLSCAMIGNTQTARDLFTKSDVKISWLGIDFSHVKLVGDFSQLCSTPETKVHQVPLYFRKWNHIVMAEPEKFNIAWMLQKDSVLYDIDMLMDINDNANLESIETSRCPSYSAENLKEFIGQYNLDGREGIGVFFIAECLNKNIPEGIFHFVAINMKTKEILLHERLSGQPGGFGHRNYWANSVYQIIKQIDRRYYYKWQKESLK